MAAGYGVKMLLMVKETRLHLICPLISDVAHDFLCHLEEANNGKVYHAKLAREFILCEDSNLANTHRSSYFWSNPVAFQ